MALATQVSGNSLGDLRSPPWRPLPVCAQIMQSMSAETQSIRSQQSGQRVLRSVGGQLEYVDRLQLEVVGSSHSSVFAVLLRRRIADLRLADDARESE